MFVSLPLKDQGDSYSFGIVESEYINQFLYHSQKVRRKDSIQKLRL